MRCGLLLSILLAGAPLAAAPPTVPPPGAAPAAPLDAHRVVAEVRRVIAERYVLPERRPVIDAILARGLASGRYDVTDPSLFADRVNADLATAHDRHLSFHYQPHQAELLAAGLRAQPDTGAAEREDRAANQGVTELRLLPGNVRYMRYDGFIWDGDESKAVLDEAMRFLSGGDAVIIDLRRNGGGSGEAGRYIISHFLPPGRPLVTFYMNGQPPDHVSTLPDVPSRMVGKPLYVLISSGSASAAEGFSGNVAGYHIGELVGANTAGAGFRNDLVPLPGGFVLSVSIGRAVLASTGKDWEGVGIAPTTPVAVDKALDVARLHALQRLALSAPPPAKRRLDAMATLLSASLNPVAPALPLSAYAGSFGDRTVRLEGDALTWQRENGPKVRMIAVGPNQFAFEEDPTTRVEFKVAGNNVESLDVVRGDGSRQTETRRP